MDEDYDIYGDLDGFQVEAQKENKVIQELKGEIEELNVQIATKETEKQTIANENEILLENISSLLLTAKAELKRKDSLIADIRRQMDNNAFRRNRANVKKCDKYTQTTLIRMLNQEIQTDTVGTMTEPIKDRAERKPLSSTHVRRRERTKSPIRKKSVQPSDLRSRLHTMREKSSKEKKREDILSDKHHRDRKSSQPERIREREREREKERRARHRDKSRSPKISTVRFSHPHRVPRKELDKIGTESEAKFSQTFIPMNQRELDQFVKEIGRSDNRSPDEICPVNNKKKHDMLETSSSELWDNILSQKESVATNVEENMIQSDEIGTTLSPGKLEDVEQKMRHLHGEQTPVAQRTSECLLMSNFTSTLQPTPVVVPRPEPPIVEQVPDLAFEDETRLNDSRELRIVESDEIVAEKNVIIDKGKEKEHKNNLEDGEIASSDAESTSCRSRSRQKSSTGSDKHRKTSPKSKKERKSLEDKADYSAKKTHSQKDRREKSSPKDERKSKRKSDSSCETSTRNGRRKSEQDASSVTRILKSDRLHESSTKEPHNKSKKETIQQLFGTDDESSLCEAPTVGKRRLSARSDGSKDTKKQRVHSKDKETADNSGAQLQSSISFPDDKQVKQKSMLLDNVTPKKLSDSKEESIKPLLKDVCINDATSSVKEMQDERLSNNAKASTNVPKMTCKERKRFNSGELTLASLGKLDAKAIDYPENMQIDLTDPKEAPIVSGLKTSDVDQLIGGVSNEIVMNPVTEPSCADANQMDQVSLHTVIEGISLSVTSHREERSSSENASQKIPEADLPTENSNASIPNPKTAEQDFPTVRSPEKDKREGQSTEEIPIGTNPKDQLSKHLSPRKTGLEGTFVGTEQRSQESPVQIDSIPVSAPEATSSSPNNLLLKQKQLEIFTQESTVSSVYEDTAANKLTVKRHSKDAPSLEILQDQPHMYISTENAKNSHPTDVASVQATPVKDSANISQNRSPDVVIFSNKYGEYRVEENNESEITIYVTRNKKKKNKSSRLKLSTSVEIKSSAS